MAFSKNRRSSSKLRHRLRKPTVISGHLKVTKKIRGFFSKKLKREMHSKMNSFRIAISDDVITDLRNRLANTRWSAHTNDVGWKAGTSPEYLRELVEYWKTP